jgi:orotate phosphoribosyltransferase
MSKIIEMLKKVDALITDDHFVYTSGKHGEVYINKDALYPYTDLVSEIGKMFAEEFKDYDIDVVVGPALGGIILSQWTAYHLSQIKDKRILSVYTEKDENKNQVFTRNYDKIVEGKNILVIEDITNTGGSVVKVINSVKNAGGNIVATGVMVNRNSEVNAKSLGFEFKALGFLEANAYDENEIPDWLAKRPINTNVGHGKKYLQAKGLL